MINYVKTIRKLIVLVSAAYLICSCAVKKENFGEPELKGTWEGSVSEESALKKSWIIVRNADGRYTKKITTAVGNRIQHHTQAGIWWTHEHFYFEKPSSEASPEKFDYQFNNPKTIIFSSASEAENQQQFSEKKIR